MKLYDVFISYNSKDLHSVCDIVLALRRHSIRCWFDKFVLLPGMNFQKEIENGLKHSEKILVFIGNNGIGAWEEVEYRTYLNESIKNGVTIIPILLPETDKEEIPTFLKNFQWVDFSKNINDPESIDKLISGINTNFQEFELLHKSNRPISNSGLNKLKFNTIQAYNKIAEKFAEVWYDHPPYEILDMLTEIIPKESLILDAGCGPGHHANYLKKQGHNIVGIDLSESMINIARKATEGVEFMQMNMLNTTFLRNTFDCVWSVGSALHIPREEFLSLLYEYKRVLKRNGTLGLSLQIERDSEIVKDGRFFEFYESREELVSLLNYVGFNNISLKYSETSRNTHGENIILKWLTLYGELEIEKPRDYHGSFEPQLVKKR